MLFVFCVRSYWTTLLTVNAQLFQEVASVKIPGVDGEYGVTAGHTPIISQLKPGVVAIQHEAVRICGRCCSGVSVDNVISWCRCVSPFTHLNHQGSEAEKFFVSGGFALTHADSTTVGAAGGRRGYFSGR